MGAVLPGWLCLANHFLEVHSDCSQIVPEMTMGRVLQFLPVSAITIWGQIALCGGAILGTTGCRAASLPSTHSVPATFLPPKM